MKKVLFILVLVGLGVFVSRARIESFLEKKGVITPATRTKIESFCQRLTPKLPEKKPQLHGTYVEQRPFVCEIPPFGIRFVDGKTAYLLRGGEVIGHAVTYTVRGDRVLIKHACGTWVLQIQPGGLYHQDFKHLFVTQ